MDYPHRLKDFSGIFRKIPWEYARWNIPGIFREYFKHISMIIQRDISTKYLWYIQGIFHGILRERINVMTYSSFFPENFQKYSNGRFQINISENLQRNLSCNTATLTAVGIVESVITQLYLTDRADYIITLPKVYITQLYAIGRMLYRQRSLPYRQNTLPTEQTTLSLNLQ